MVASVACQVRRRTRRTIASNRRVVTVCMVSTKTSDMIRVISGSSMTVIRDGWGRGERLAEDGANQGDGES